MKTCTRCKEEKPPSDFYDPSRYWCKPCHRTDTRERIRRARAARPPAPKKPRQRQPSPRISVDFYTLWAWLDNQIGRPLPYLKDVAVLTCTKYQTTWERRHKNRIPVEAAHDIATHFGVTPTDIWPNWPGGHEQ